ncbi:MAG: MATE family efflux transporter [Asticcacaulis sp.]|nr:MATE family efflux transporter [Asticcacaulis sp.]
MQLRSQLSSDTRAAFAALYRLSWPVVTSRVGVMLMAFLDTVIVGRYSSAELSFLMLAQALFWVPAVSSMGLLMGIQVKTAHFLGAGDVHRIGAVFQRGMAYALVLGFGLMLVLLLAGTGILGLIVKPELAAGSRIPLVIFAASMPFFLVLTACSQFLEALSRTRDVMITTLIANVVNVVLLLVFVPGHVPGIHGAVGAALATLIARSLQAIGLLIHILRLNETRPYNLLGRQDPDPAGATEQRHIGYATGASYFIETAAFAGMTLFAGRISEEAVAAWSIILNFASIVFMGPMGMSAGCSVLVGKAYGAHDREGLKLMGRVSFVSAAAFMIVVVVLMLLFAWPVTRLYTGDPVLQPLVHQGLLLSCLFYIPDGLQVVAAQALRARKDVLAPTVIHYLSYGAIMLPLGFLFSQSLGLGVAGLVYAVVVASAISGTFQTGRFLWLDRA